MKSQISKCEDVEQILMGLGERLAGPVQFLVIGGAAMLEYGLKDVTKDIDPRRGQVVTLVIGSAL